LRSAGEKTSSHGCNIIKYGIGYDISRHSSIYTIQVEAFPYYDIFNLKSEKRGTNFLLNILQIGIFFENKRLKKKGVD
jgi:hypothetical protein